MFCDYTSLNPRPPIPIPNPFQYGMPSSVASCHGSWFIYFYWNGLGVGIGGRGLRRGIDNTLNIFMLLKVALSLRH